MLCFFVPKSVSSDGHEMWSIFGPSVFYQGVAKPTKTRAQNVEVFGSCSQATSEVVAAPKKYSLIKDSVLQLIYEEKGCFCQFSREECLILPSQEAIRNAASVCKSPFIFSSWLFTNGKSCFRCCINGEYYTRFCSISCSCPTQPNGFSKCMAHFCILKGFSTCVTIPVMIWGLFKSIWIHSLMPFWMVFLGHQAPPSLSWLSL